MKKIVLGLLVALSFAAVGCGEAPEDVTATHSALSPAESPMSSSWCVQYDASGQCVAWTPQELPYQFQVFPCSYNVPPRLTSVRLFSGPNYTGVCKLLILPGYLTGLQITDLSLYGWYNIGTYKKRLYPWGPLVNVNVHYDIASLIMGNNGTVYLLANASDYSPQPNGQVNIYTHYYYGPNTSVPYLPPSTFSSIFLSFF